MSDVFMPTLRRKLMSDPYGLDVDHSQDEILSGNAGAENAYKPTLEHGSTNAPRTAIQTSPNPFSARLDAAPDISSVYSPAPALPNTPDFKKTVTPGLEGAYAEAAQARNAAHPSDPSPAFSPFPLSQRQPDIVHDVYQPRMNQLAEQIDQQLQPRHMGKFRTVAAGLLSARAPALANVISGDYQRNRTLQPLEQEYGLLSDIISKNRAQQTTDITNRLHGAQADYWEQRPDLMAQPKQQTPQEQALVGYMKTVNPKTGKPYLPQEALAQINQDAQDVKPERATHTSPFEAFAYGSPEEKKAAQDFLAFEKRMGTQYQRPSDAEVRYQLFQRDPEGYKEVFGDRGQAAGDRAHATAMLKFFQKQRDEISKDFMLGDDEKAQKLQEIDQLQKPFMGAAGVGGPGNSGNDRVTVIHPNGTRGTIPRSQLPAARRKGYRVAQ